MDIEKEQLKLRLFEAQAQVLQYQHKEVSATIKAFQDSQIIPVEDVNNLNAPTGS